MPIIFIENHYPVHKNKEVLAAWLRAIEKYPQPEGLFTTLVDTAVSSNQNGLKVLSAYLISPGKYEEASAYFRKFITEFFTLKATHMSLATGQQLRKLWSQLVNSHPQDKESHTR